jgi:hypothetical protein
MPNETDLTLWERYLLDDGYKSDSQLNIRVPKWMSEEIGEAVPDDMSKKEFLVKLISLGFQQLKDTEGGSVESLQ